MKTNNRGSEKTAIISIFKQYDESPNKCIYYYIRLFIIGEILYPPYMPVLRVKVDHGTRKEIVGSVESLKEKYLACFDDFELSEKECESIMEEIRAVGVKIYREFTFFEKLIPALLKMKIKHIIFHTNDFEIPWNWVYDFSFEGNASNLIDNFILNKFSTGTIICDVTNDDLDKTLRTLKNGEEDVDKANDEYVYLFQGVLGNNENDKNRSKEYISHFVDFFKNENAKAFTYEDWESYGSDEDEFIDEFLAPKFRKAKVIHFSGHIVEGKLKFDDNLLISPERLGERLVDFMEKPLVVLHGCSSGSIVDSSNMQKQLSTMFLEKGAGGCLVALLPVDTTQNPWRNF